MKDEMGMSRIGLMPLIGANTSNLASLQDNKDASCLSYRNLLIREPLWGVHWECQNVFRYLIVGLEYR